jgi:predicted nucleotidyltransferase
VIRRRTNLHTKTGRRERHHAPAASFSQLTDDNRRLFLLARAALIAIGCPAEMYAFGSRVHGCWTDNSDLDIMVVGTDKLTFTDIRKASEALLIEGIRIDLQCGKPSRMNDRFLISDRVSKTRGDTMSKRRKT